MGESTDSPPLLSQLLPEDTPLPEDTSPTLPESSMLPRERLRLMPMLMLTTDTTDMPDLMLTVLDTEATDSDTQDTLPMVLTHMPTELPHMPMVLMLMERDPLMPSQRLMPMLTTDTTDMPDLMLMVLDTPDKDMDTHKVMDMPGESKLFQPKVLSYCKPKAK